MPIEQVARDALQLQRIEFGLDAEIGGGPALLVLTFNGAETLVLSVDRNTDELRWGAVKPQESALSDLAPIAPAVKKAYGLHVTWSWEMKNHQGFFDALQLEFTDAELRNSVILQFKVAASQIAVFEVLNLSVRNHLAESR